MARLLIVDPYQDAADVLGLILAKSGHEARVAYHEDEATAIADQFQPELLITECTLGGYPRRPDRCGLRFGQEMMTRHRCKGIVLSALAGQSYAAEARHRGFCCYLLKPCNAALIEKAIADALGQAACAAAQDDSSASSRKKEREELAALKAAVDAKLAALSDALRLECSRPSPTNFGPENHRTSARKLLPSIGQGRSA